MDNDLNKIISAAMAINNLDVTSKTLREIIKKFHDSFKNNQDAFIQAGRIDIKNNNGFKIDFDIIENIFSIVEKEPIVYGKVILSQKDDDKKIMYGKQIMNRGTVAIINDGNPYVIIETLLRNILANNKVIFCNNGYMYGTNNLIIHICQTILEQYQIPKNMIQLYVTDNYKQLLSSFTSINLVVCVGNRKLRNQILELSKIPVITSGYENFDLYIESERHLEFIKKIKNLNLNINIYKTPNINLEYENILEVEDVDEAIAQINFNGNMYSTAIFTESSENASKFIKEVHSHIVTINTSPTIERLLDISEEDLTVEKTVIYPQEFTFDGNQEIVEIF